MTLEPKPNHTNRSIQKSQKPKKARQVFVKFLFFLCCLRFIRSKRNITLKSETHRIVEKLVILLHDNTPSHTSKLVHDFWPKTNRNHASATVFIGLGPRSLFPEPRTGDTDERKAFCYCIKNTGAVSETKKPIWDEFRELEKRWHRCFTSGRLYWRG